MPFIFQNNTIGYQTPNPYFVPDTTQREPLGFICPTADLSYWGGAEFIYLKVPASLAVPMGALVVWDSTYTVALLPSTANLAQSFGVSTCVYPSSTDVAYGWFQVSGRSPVASTNAATAGVSLFISATAGAAFVTATAGKQLLNLRTDTASSATLAKTNVNTQNGSPVLRMSNVDGIFLNGFLSGTGIPANAIVGVVDTDKRTVTMYTNGTTTPLNATATGAVTVTQTNNNGTIFYPLCYYNRPFAQGQIT